MTKKFKNFVVITFAIVIMLTGVIPVQELQAKESEIKVMVNGEYVKFDESPILEDGRVFVPMRAIFEALGFEVRWDSEFQLVLADLIEDYYLISVRLYSGDKMNVGYTEYKKADTYIINHTNNRKSQDMSTYFNNKTTLTPPYKNINGRILVPVRAIGEGSGANVTWDSTTKTVIIDSSNLMMTDLETGISYDVNNAKQRVDTYFNNKDTVITNNNNVQDNMSEANVQLGNTHMSYIKNSAEISSVQQFLYKNDGLAYGYLENNNLVINTPSKTLSIPAKYPKLGDIISDDDGNFYIVWGKDVETPSEESIFISKYTESGKHVKTTGFTGTRGGNSESNTKSVFIAGSCDSSIANDLMMVTYARTMHNGHQSNHVVGVNISDMSAYKWDSLMKIPYNSHSFNQSVVWSNKINGFVYADQGDAYGRGFKITTDNWKNIIFDFYLQTNANYDMSIVNKTYAQMAGLVELDNNNIALVGASVKSISDNANNEKQNLFIQIFDPSQSKVNSSMFVGGITRSGYTSTNINDNKNTPLTPVTNYGVHWLTDYTNTDVIAPHVVYCDDRIAILWSTTDKSYYMVVSNTGEIITNSTEIDVKLNSYESPVYYDGYIYWVSVANNKLSMNSISIK